MKWNILVGSMVLGVSLAGQSFGAGLLDRMLGGHGSGCASSCCDTSVCEPSCGCEMAACEVAPSCGCEIAACGPSAGPSCGCEMAACEAAPSCGCEIAACDPCASACDTGCGHGRKKHRGLLARLFDCHKKDNCCAAPSCGCEVAACEPCAPSCGCEMAACEAAPSCGCEIAACDPCASACDSGCGLGHGKGRKHGGLLARLFHHKDRGCDACDACGMTVAAPCSSCNGGSYNGGSYNVAPQAAPAAPAPVVDPSAYLNSKRRVIQASSTTVR
jgi:hypothetical protein